MLSVIGNSDTLLDSSGLNDDPEVLLHVLTHLEGVIHCIFFGTCEAVPCYEEG